MSSRFAVPGRRSETSPTAPASSACLGLRPISLPPGLDVLIRTSSCVTLPGVAEHGNTLPAGTAYFEARILNSTSLPETNSALDELARDERVLHGRGGDGRPCEAPTTRPHSLRRVRWRRDPGFRLVAMKDVRRLMGLEPPEVMGRPHTQQLMGRPHTQRLTRIDESGAGEELVRVPVELLVEEPEG